MYTLKGIVSGRVQGVGFRYFVQTQALAENLNGYAKNLPDGCVEFVLQGEEPNVKAVELKIHQGPKMSRVDAVTLIDKVDDNHFLGFDIY